METTFYREREVIRLKMSRDLNWEEKAENLDRLSQNSIALFNLFESSRSNFITSSFIRSALHHAFIDSRTLETAKCCISDVLKLVGNREIKGEVNEIFMDFVCSCMYTPIENFGKSLISEPDSLLNKSRCFCRSSTSWIMCTFSPSSNYNNRLSLWWNLFREISTRN